jgi:hypothetical protein
MNVDCSRCPQWKGESMYKGSPCALGYVPGECTVLDSVAPFIPAPSAPAVDDARVERAALEFEKHYYPTERPSHNSLRAVLRLVLAAADAVPVPKKLGEEEGR